MDLTAIIIVMIVIGLPIILGVGGDIYKKRLEFKKHELELMSERTAEKAAQYASESQQLKERVAVLERIATDSGVSISAEIEKLRDDRTSTKKIEQLRDEHVN